MYHRRRARPWRILTALLVCAVGAAEAATERTRFVNDFHTNYVFLFAEQNAAGPPVMSFTDLDLQAGMRDWTLDTFTPTLAIFHGTTVAPRRGRLRLDFDYAPPEVALQWAEVLYDSVAGTYAVQGAGSAVLDASGRRDVWRDTAEFSARNARLIDAHFGAIAAPVPLPDSAGLMLAAVAFLGFQTHGAARRAARLQPAAQAA